MLSATVPRFRRPQFLFVSQGSQAWDRWDRWERWERWDRGTAEGDFHRLRDRPVHWWPLLLVATWCGSLDLTVKSIVAESFISFISFHFQKVSSLFFKMCEN